MRGDEKGKLAGGQDTGELQGVASSAAVVVRIGAMLDGGDPNYGTSC